MPFETLESTESRGGIRAALWRAAVAVFLFFASLRLALLILAALIVVFATGTFVESFHGTEAAAILVYQAPWFPLLGFLLVLNLTASALTRWPWKKKHIGFVTTHAGIIIILIGSYITQNFMIDGQMAIEEGKSEYRISLPQEPYLYVYPENRMQPWGFAIQRKAFPWQGTKRLHPDEGGIPFEVMLRQYLPKGRLEESLVPAESGPAAVQITLQNSFVNQTLWLMENDPARGSTQLGPASISFRDERLKTQTEKASPAGYLEFVMADGKQERIPLSESMSLPFEFKIGDTGLEGAVTAIYRNAVIAGREIQEKDTPPEAWENPAAVLKIQGNGREEKHTVFARFPDFPTMHGMQPSAFGLRLFYRHEDPAAEEARELRLIEEEGKLFYQIRNREGIQEGALQEGDPVSTGWMDLSLSLKAFMPHARVEKSFEAVPATSEAAGVFRAIEIEIPETGRRIWLPQGFAEAIEIGGKKYHFFFAERRIPAGFQLQLVDFRVEHYPGTNRPASYESDVLLRDGFRGIEKKTTVSMNEPLDYNNFRVFQASYIQEPGQPDISIFSVVRDPGIFLKYSGTIVMVGGIIFMFSKGRLRFRKKGEETGEEL